MKVKSLTLLSLVAMFGLTACGGAKFNTVDQIKSNGVLTVGTNAEFAPFEYIDNGEITGLDMDLIKAYGSYLGVKVDIQDMDFDAALLSASKGKVDCAIAAVTKNAKREQTLSFSNAYYSSNQVVIVKDDSPYAALTTEDAILSALTSNKASIGCQRGTTGQYYIEGDEDWEFDGIADSTCKTYDTGALAVKDLQNGKLDAVVIDSAPANIYVTKYEGVKVLPVVLTEEEYAIAVTKGNQTLVDSINTFIADAKKNGTFDEIVNKYFGE